MKIAKSSFFNQVFLEPANENKLKLDVLEGQQPKVKSALLRMEAVEGLEVKVFKDRISVWTWTRNRVVFFWALAQLGDSALPIKANFKFNRARPKLQGRNETAAQSSQKSPRAFLTEEQIFSLDWKVEKLYRED